MNLSDQESLVSLFKAKAKQKVKRQIPGGGTLLKVLDHEGLDKAVYNWIRSVRSFEDFTICLAKNPDDFDLEVTKVQFFPESKLPIWEAKIEGKKHVAKLISDLIKKNKFVSVTLKKDGIYLAKDKKDKFGPTRKATEKDVSETVKAGDTIRSEAWEPYIEFTPLRAARRASS